MTRSILISLLFVSNLTFAVELPPASPKVKLTQDIGLTEVTVEYSSPAVHGREIWGELVKYDQVWRAGANAATRISFTKDVAINKVSVPAGVYAFFVIPHKTGTWTLLLNKDANQFGTDRYSKQQNLVAVEVKPETIPARERLTYLFSDFSDDGGTLQLEWENVRLSLPIAFNTAKQVSENLEELDKRGWHMFNEVAIYELEQKKDYDAALKWVDKSLRVGEDWFNLWTKARVLAAKGDYKQAVVWGQKAQQLGPTWPGFKNHTEEVKRALGEWKQKS